MFDERLSAALALYWTFEGCKAEELELPASTGHIKCDDALCIYLSEGALAMEESGRTQYIDIRAVQGAYKGLPVKQVFHLIPYALRISELADRDRYLRTRARKRKEANAA